MSCIADFVPWAVPLGGRLVALVGGGGGGLGGWEGVFAGLLTYPMPLWATYP